MNRKVSILTLAAVALAAFAGAAVAAPDLVHAVFAALTDHHVGAILATFSPAVLKLQREHAEHVDAMEALAKNLETRDLTAEEDKQFADHKAAAEGLKTRIAKLQASEVAAAGVARPLAEQAGQMAANLTQTAIGRNTAAAAQAASLITMSENIDNDPRRGFRDLGDLAMAVFGAQQGSRMGMQMDPRLQVLVPRGMPLAAAPSTFSGEGSGGDGGFLIPPEFSTNVFNLSLTEESLLPFTDNMPVQGNGIAIPKDEATPWGTTGPRAYWQGEAIAGTQTKAAVQLLELRLKKLMALTPVSDELLTDSVALGSYLPKRMAMSLAWKMNDSFLNGLGNGTPLGALKGSAALMQTKDSGQSSNTLSVANLLNMFSRLPPGSYDSAVWMINNTVIPALGALTLGNTPVFMPAYSPNVGGLQRPLQWLLLNRPVLITQHAAPFSSAGDVMLLDMKYYQTISKSEGVQTATSMHLYFDADATAFRVTFRVDGAPKLSAQISPASGSTKLSPFVYLEAR